MYSKEHGFMTEPPAPRRLSYRQPERPMGRPRMQVPPNYSGHAIVDGEERPLGGAESPETAGETAPSEGPVPRFDHLPRVSELGEARYRPPSVTVPLSPCDTDEQDGRFCDEACGDNPNGEDHPPAEPPEEASHAEELPSETLAEAKPTAAPPLFSLARFPFGHGIGWEELLIMGLIWLLLHENAVCGRERGDLDETVILLGLLLLLG